MRRDIVIIAAAVILTACEVKIPDRYVESPELPQLYPDYTNVTIPVNVAPLTFEPDAPADGIIARLSAGGEEVVCGEKRIQPSDKDWKRLMRQAKGGSVSVDVYIRKAGQWTHYKPFRLYVSPDSIDPYISYRLIPPSYSSYRGMTISQRCIENYKEQVIYNNMLNMTAEEGQCINCHHYQQYNPNRMQFHARHHMGGTVIVYDGKVRKINMATDSVLSVGVYPAWHPWLPLIVYSTNNTMQTFHITDPNKIEVYDTKSDLIAYDVERNEVTHIESDPSEMECFPAWSPDGKMLYFCSAHFEYNDSVDQNLDVLRRFKEIKYNLYRKSFDPETFRFGPKELVFDATVMDKSATLPRISPDGRYMMFTLGASGVFHIWHHDADLWMMDLNTGECRNMEEINSSDTESYHAWSSNGRWVVFSSRRYDGNYTRPFFAHIGKDGHGTKPFELPSADPDYHRQFLKSYNIPEFMREPVSIRPQEFADVIRREGEHVTYVRQLRRRN